MSERELEIVGTFRFPHQAALAKTTLGAFGVDAWVLDETQIRMRWFMGLALGGVKVAVRAEDADTAREILAGDHSADLAHVPEANLPPAPDELCRYCGADSLAPESAHTSKAVLLSIFSAAVGALWPHDRTRWRCRSCGREQ